MPWLIRSRGGLVHLRDGSGPDAPLYVLKDDRWWPFNHLPSGTDPAHDSDVECREVEDIEGIECAPLLQREPDPMTAPPAPAPKEQKAKRKARVR